MAGLVMVCAAQAVGIAALLVHARRQKRRQREEEQGRAQERAEASRRLVDAERRMADQMRDTVSGAQRAMAQRDATLRMLSHEVRTPVQSIVGGLNLLQRRALPPESEQLVGRMARAAAVLVRLLDNLRALSRGALRVGQVQAQPMRIASVVNDVCAAYLQAAIAKDLSIVWLGVDGPDEIVSDPQLITQVLDNLVSNAVKYTDEGSLTVTASVQPHGAQAILRLAVSDTGPGIPRAQRSRVFEPFVRLDAALQQRVDGSGLGLAIVREIVDALHGHAAIEDTEEPGTTVVVTLPVGLPAPGESDRPQVTRRTADRRAARPVLLVEDSPDARRTLLEMLAELGQAADTAEDGNHALRLMAEQPERYAGVLTDLDMPGLDGVSFARLVRADRRWHRLPIVAISALSPPAQDSPFDAHLEKPVSLTVLEATLQQLATASGGAEAQGGTSGIA